MASPVQCPEHGLVRHVTMACRHVTRLRGTYRVSAELDGEPLMSAVFCADCFARAGWREGETIELGTTTGEAERVFETIAPCCTPCLAAESDAS